MITIKQLREADPRELADPLSYVVYALIRTARLALENETSGECAKACVASTLELAEALSIEMGNGCELLERDYLDALADKAEATGAAA